MTFGALFNQLNPIELQTTAYVVKLLAAWSSDGDLRVQYMLTD
jgi:hypothetical protein